MALPSSTGNGDSPHFLEGTAAHSRRARGRCVKVRTCEGVNVPPTAADRAPRLPAFHTGHRRPRPPAANAKTLRPGDLATPADAATNKNRAWRVFGC